MSNKRSTLQFILTLGIPNQKPSVFLCFTPVSILNLMFIWGTVPPLFLENLFSFATVKQHAAVLEFQESGVEQDNFYTLPWLWLNGVNEYLLKNQWNRFFRKKILLGTDGICSKSDGKISPRLGGGNSNVFWIFHPENWGRWFPIWRSHIFSIVGKQPPRRSFFFWNWICLPRSITIKNPTTCENKFWFTFFPHVLCIRIQALGMAYVWVDYLVKNFGTPMDWRGCPQKVMFFFCVLSMDFFRFCLFCQGILDKFLWKIFQYTCWV